MKRILFVDDESNVLDGIRRMLRADRTRWDMHFAVGGEAALRACETGAFDVVVSDMRMPGMDGATLLGHIRDRYPSTARLILSGSAEMGLATRAVSLAHSYLAKPCDASEFQSAIARVCAQQDMLCTPELRRIVGTVGELPSLSATYIHLRQAVSDPSTSIRQVACIIQQGLATQQQRLLRRRPESHEFVERRVIFGDGNNQESGFSFRGLQGIRARLACSAIGLRIHAASCAPNIRHCRHAPAGPKNSRYRLHGGTSPRYWTSLPGEFDAQRVLFRSRAFQRTWMQALRS